MGFFDLFKSKPKTVLEQLAIDCVKKVETSSESVAKSAIDDLYSSIFNTPSILKDVNDYFVVGKGLFVGSFLMDNSMTSKKSRLSSLAFFFLSTSILKGKSTTDSSKSLIMMLQQSHVLIENYMRKALSVNSYPSDKEVKESITKMVYYLATEYPYSISSNEHAKFMIESLNSMLQSGRLGIGASAFKQQGKNYLVKLNSFIEGYINAGTVNQL